ncbi:MAG: hypothetical protein H6Q59_609 [Firmicutes bacterium]|nr:hypothetical protein [Bacillota bacterium]
MSNSTSTMGSTNSKEFWESLHLDILTSNQKAMQEDYRSFIERSFIFSLLYRGCHPLELIGFRRILSIKENGYIMILKFSEPQLSGIGEEAVDEFDIHQSIRRLFPNKNICVGPLIMNRICLLITDDDPVADQLHKELSLRIAEELSVELKQHFHLDATIGIGSQQNINTIYSSFIAALSAQYHWNSEIIYYQESFQDDSNAHFDYILAEQHLLESIRLRKSEAYDYFSLMMDSIRAFSDATKRNKILEILVLSNHAMTLDSQNDIKFINYTGIAEELKDLKGEELIENAYRNFILITSYVKPQSNIDYSNHIVKATKEYLENHYSEDISLEDVAEQVNISPQYFSKLIKKTTGFNFIDWLSMLRVKKAKELLTNSNLTVKEVCFMVGYKDPNYFSRIFKKRIGITPSEYIYNMKR